MPKLPVINSKKLAKFLEKLGFRQDHATGSHFIFYNFETKKMAVVPRHQKDLAKGTLISILKETGISREDFEDLLK